MDLLSKIETLEKENEKLKSNAEHNEQLIEQYWWENKHYKHIIDELEKWLRERKKQYDNVGLKFKKQGNFECASRSYDYLKQYQTILSKLQELKGSDEE